ncbi:hypothetical protein Tco_0600443 [Tanacetum coccineum]|uniref:Hybrid signal transduction histidine kinase M n=1 Tax=Tanacetum coccineum TaxID=301880 RepID=A0ABQ4WBX2_9ASTR
MTITNLITLVPVKLDIDEMNYSSWIYFFKNLCKGPEILKHIMGESTDEETLSNLLPSTPKWLKINSVVLSWIFMTFRSIALKAELRSLKLGDLSIDAYFCKIESMATILTSLESSISNDDVVTIALKGKYQNVSGIIAHREPFLDLKTVHSMLITEEMQLKSRAQATSIHSSSTYPMILLTNSSNSTRGSNVAPEKINKPCFNFNKGFVILVSIVSFYIESGNVTMGQSNSQGGHTPNLQPVAFHATAIGLTQFGPTLRFSPQ